MGTWEDVSREQEVCMFASLLDGWGVFLSPVVAGLPTSRESQGRLWYGESSGLYVVSVYHSG